MKKIHKNLLIYFITVFFIIVFLIHNEDLINTLFKVCNLLISNLLPSMIVFFTITDILNNYDFPYYISHIFGKLIEKLYKLPGTSSYIIFMSMTTGFPGNAKLIKEELDNQRINSNDATKLLTMTHFSNPLFVIYAVGINFFSDKKVGIIILLAHFITNFIIGFFFRNLYPYERKKLSIKHQKTLPFHELLKSSFINTTKILINVFGIIIFISLLTKIINYYLDFKTFSNVIFNGLVEITTGLNTLSFLQIEKAKAYALATFFISFGGFSIHLQTMSILSKYNVNYYVYLIARILHGAISSFIVLAYYK